MKPRLYYREGVLTLLITTRVSSRRAPGSPTERRWRSYIFRAECKWGCGSSLVPRMQGTKKDTRPDCAFHRTDIASIYLVPPSNVPPCACRTTAGSHIYE
jgi:hypothetical protein